MVTIGPMRVSIKGCQSLSGGLLDSACMEYLAFWSMFKVLRIMLIVLVMVKLPVLLGNCNRRVCKDKDNQKREICDGLRLLGGIRISDKSSEDGRSCAIL